MKTLSSTVLLLLFVGCGSPSAHPGPLTVAETTQPSDMASSPRNEDKPYSLLSQPPDANLEGLATEFRSLSKDFDSQSFLKQRFASTKLDGQQVIKLLEIACYADVQCHAVEYPLRVATLDYVRDNLDSPDVRSAVRWIASSYDSQLPMDAPGDTEGHLKGMLVRAMNVRMTQYAIQLLGHRPSADKSK